MNITEFYRLDQNNPGDWFSNPSRYFFPQDTVSTYDIDKLRKTTWSQEDPIIVGGGGLIGNDNFELFIDRLTTHPDEQLLKDVLENKMKNISVENSKLLHKWRQEVQLITVNTMLELNRKHGPRILWGAGHNSKDTNLDSYSVNYPDYLNKFHLVGVRDWEVGYRWVPCASCMHPAFDKSYEIKNEFVWFEHKKRLLDNKAFDHTPAPRMLNTGQNMEQVIEFLGSAEVVVTNSYHGVYWATLLGRKVVCVPWGSKFKMFKHPPALATADNWHELFDKAVSYKGALDECRDANKLFYNDVMKLLKK
jgi:hypothetical protein